MSLSERKCVPCEGGIPPLNREEITSLLNQLNGWSVEGDKKITKEYKFNNFVEAVDFTNKITVVAESEGHHPDLFVAWGKVTVYIWTHKVNGLTENDFILAAKIDEIS